MCDHAPLNAAIRSINGNPYAFNSPRFELTYDFCDNHVSAPNEQYYLEMNVNMDGLSEPSHGLTPNPVIACRATWIRPYSEKRKPSLIVTFHTKSRLLYPALSRNPLREDLPRRPPSGPPFATNTAPEPFSIIAWEGKGFTSRCRLAPHGRSGYYTKELVWVSDVDVKPH